MKRLSMISVGLGVLLAGSISARAAENSELWDDMVLTAYGAPDSEQARGNKGEARGNKGEAQQDAAQAQAQQEQAAQQEQQAQQGQQAQGAQADKGEARANKGDARNQQDAAQAQQEAQQEQQAQQGQQEQVSKPQRGKLFFHDEGGDNRSNEDAALNPNLEPLSYFLGFWDCTANVTDPNGNEHTFNKSVLYKSVFGGNWVAAAWGKGDSGNGNNTGGDGTGAGNGNNTGGGALSDGQTNEQDQSNEQANQGDQRFRTTHHHIGGAATEGYNPYTQEFVNMCITHTGGYGYATSPGWDNNNSLVWTGEAWNVHGHAHIYKQVTIAQTDQDNFTVNVATGDDGTNFNQVGTATCTRGQHPSHGGH